MENPLQEKLQEMESASPSPNSHEQGAARHLRGRLRALTNTLRGVEKIEQQESVYDPDPEKSREICRRLYAAEDLRRFIEDLPHTIRGFARGSGSIRDRKSRYHAACKAVEGALKASRECREKRSPHQEYAEAVMQAV